MWSRAHYPINEAGIAIFLARSMASVGVVWQAISDNLDNNQDCSVLGEATGG